MEKIKIKIKICNWGITGLEWNQKWKKKKEKGKKKKRRLQQGLLWYVSLRFEIEHLIQDHIPFLQGNEYATHQSFLFGFFGGNNVL